MGHPLSRAWFQPLRRLRQMCSAWRSLVWAVGCCVGCIIAHWECICKYPKGNFYAQYATPQRRGACHGVFYEFNRLGQRAVLPAGAGSIGCGGGGLGGSLSAAHAHLCFAIKKSRESGLGELEGGLTSLQTELEGLIARLQPALLFQAQQPV